MVGQQKREREKINRPEHTAGRSQNKGTEQVQRRARRLRTGPAPLEAGGRQEGKGAGSAPRTASPTALQIGLQSLIKDLLRFWMVDIPREGRGETQGAGTRPARAGTGAGDGGQKACRTRGECAHQAPGCLSRSAGEGTKSRRSFLFRAFVEYRRAGTARCAGHATYRAAGSLSSPEGKAAPSLPAARGN